MMPRICEKAISMSVALANHFIFDNFKEAGSPLVPPQLV